MKILLFANTDWYLYNFRRSLALTLQDEGYEVVLASPDGPYGEKLQALGLRWIQAPMERRSLNPWRELNLILWLRRLLIEEKVDLIHNFTIKCVVYGSLAARMNLPTGSTAARVNAVAGMGYVFTSRDVKAQLLKPLVNALMRITLGGKNARLILQNPDDVSFFENSTMVASQHIRLILGSGADCGRFTPAMSPRRSGPFRVVLPARLLWDKGIQEYVDAATALREENADIVFLLAGDPDEGNPAAVPKQTVRDWVASGVIEWLGHVQDMPELFRSVDAVVLPSYREGLPKGLIEAGASGLPLVTTDVPGCREVVTNGVDGLLVPPKDAPALANAIRTLQHNPELCQRLGRAARVKALAQFDEKHVISKTIGVYQELMPAHQPTRAAE